MLAEHGYHGTGLKKILETVEVPKGSFYNYFASKEEFVSETIGQYSRNSARKLDDFVEKSNDDPVTKIRKIFLALLTEIEANGQRGCLVGNLAAEIGTSSALCQRSMQHAFASWKERFIDLISDAQNQNLLRQDLSAEILCDTLWDTWQGALLKMKIDGNTSHLKKTLEVMLDHLFVPAASIQIPEES